MPEGKATRATTLSTRRKVLKTQRQRKAAPPRAVTLVANTNSSTLSWQPRLSKDVVGSGFIVRKHLHPNKKKRVYLEGKRAPRWKETITSLLIVSSRKSIPANPARVSA
jgi:hypothetical protein